MTIFAPYTFCWSLGNTTNYKIPDLTTAKKILNLQAATSAFIISDNGSGIWSGFSQSIPDLTAFVKAGGYLIMSVGGANGPWLQDTMTQDQIVTNLSNILNQTGSRALDFDL